MLVIDSNIALYAFSGGPYRDEARLVISQSSQLIVPDIFFGECANVLTRLVRVGTMTAIDALRALGNIADIVKLTSATEPLVKRAFDLALRINHGLFDCLYLEVARMHGARLVTADARFIAKLHDDAQLGRLALHLSDWRPEETAP